MFPVLIIDIKSSSAKPEKLQIVKITLMISVETLTHKQTARVHLQKKYSVDALGFTALLLIAHCFHQINFFFVSYCLNSKYLPLFSSSSFTFLAF